MNVTNIYSGLYRMHGATKWVLLFNTKLAGQNVNSTLSCLYCNIPLPDWFKGDIRTLVSRKLINLDLLGYKKLLLLAFQFLSMPLILFTISRNTDVIIFHGEQTLSASIFTRIFFRKAKHIYYCYSSPRELYDLQDHSRKTFGIWFTILKPLLLLYRTLDRALVRRFPMVLVWSKEHQSYVQNIYGDLNYIIVPAAVDFGTLILNEKTREHVTKLKNKYHTGNKTVFLMNASLTAKKRIEIFLQLIKDLGDRSFDTHTFIIGEGPELEKLLSLSRHLGIQDTVTFLGYVSQGELPLYYHICDILFYLEQRGVWSMSVIEAAAAFKPVITAHGGSMDTLVVDNLTGYILDTENEYDYLLTKTTYLLDNPEKRISMGEANYEHCKQFSTEYVFNVFSSMLSGLLKQ